jgi:hypothetical protein
LRSPGPDIVDLDLGAENRLLEADYNPRLDVAPALAACPSAAAKKAVEDIAQPQVAEIKLTPKTS